MGEVEGEWVGWLWEMEVMVGFIVVHRRLGMYT